MFRRMKKTPQVSISLEHTASQNRYNLKEGECRWPTFIHGGNVKNCEFDYEIVGKINSNMAVVTLRKGTPLFHSTIGRNGDNWWTISKPKNTQMGGAFFDAGITHTTLRTGNYILQYKLKCDINLLFIRNIYKEFKTSVGNVLVKSPKFYMKMEELEKEYDLKFDGYMGCNECEIFIFNNVIEKCVNKKPNAIKRGMFID